DVRAWDGVTVPLLAEGCRVLVPYLRGYGPTRFLDPGEPRMAQQAAIGQDLLDFMDALGLERPSLAGYDWGGRGAGLAAVRAAAPLARGRPGAGRRLRAHRGRLRHTRPRPGGDPLLPAPAPQRAGRSALRRDRAPARGAAAHRGADRDPARPGRRGRPSPEVG